MKMLKIGGLVGTCLVAAMTLLLVVPEAHAAAGAVKDLALHHADAGLYAAQFALAVGLDNLRAQRDQLTRDAAAKLAQQVDGLPADQVRAIESEHAAITANLRQVNDAIATAERQANPPAPTNAQAVEQATRAERERVTQLSDIAARAGAPAEQLQQAISGGTTVEAFRTACFDLLATRSAGNHTTGVHAQVDGDEAQARRTAMTDALVTRMHNDNPTRSGRPVEMPEHARRYAQMGLVEMAAELINYRGSRVLRSRQVDDIIQRAMMTTSDFPAILQDAVNRRLLSRYQAAAAVYRRIAARWTAADFRVANVVRAGDFPQLQEVQESGEIKSGKFSESKETIQVKPYGVKFNLSRQMIINDNLGAIDQMLGSYGERVTDWENGMVLDKLVANPVLLTDNTAIFDASAHKNYTSSGTAIAVASVGIGRAALAKQKSLDGLDLDIEPAILLTSPDKRTVAEQLLTSITPAASADAVPESMKRIIPLSSGKLTGNAWYLLADPAVAPILMYALLEGFEGPRLTLEQMFGVQGIAVQLEHDFGVSGIDYRGGYKNAGA
ncbi:MAG: hypothetical protein ACK4UO_06185 [Pseudolabrys sp.]